MPLPLSRRHQFLTLHLLPALPPQEQHADVEDVGDDLEQVEVLQKKFDDFQADLKANEVRLAEMNEIAVQLMTLGQTEAALRIQTQIQVRYRTRYR